MRKSFTLSKKEKEMMDLFWDAEAPLSRLEILDQAEQRKCSWKPNSVHILLNSLLEKGAVEVAGMYLNSRKLGRTFKAAITREEYAVMQVELAAGRAKAEGAASPDKMMAALLEGDVSDETLDEMMQMIEAKKRQTDAKKKKK